MAKLGAALDVNPFESGAGLGPALDFNPFETAPPDERELNLPPLEGQVAEGIPLPPERERPVPLPTARPAEATQESALDRTLTAIGDIPEAVLRGYYGAKQGINIIGLETGQYTPEEAAAGIAESQMEARKNAMPESIRKGMEAFQKAKGWKEAVTALAEHPDVLPSVLGESAASSLVASGTGLLGALTGAAVGSVVPVVGTAAGATAGLATGTGLGSAATEYASSLNDFLTSQGIDTSDPEQLKAAFLNSEIMAAARKDAAIRGVAVGAFDALTAGVAGKLFSPVKKALGKGAVGAVAGTAAEIGAQAAGGAGGEAAAQLGTKGEITSPSDVLLEAAGEIIPGLGEVAVSKITGASPAAKVEGEPKFRPEEEAPAAPPSPEKPVEAPGAEPSPPPEAAAPAAPAAPIPANEDIAILKGAGYDIEQILDMSPREFAAKVKDATESGAKPAELDAEDIAAIEAAKPATLGEAVAQPEGLAPTEEAAPAPEVAPTPEPVAPSARGAELVQEGVPPLEAIKEAGAAPIEPTPPAAPAPVKAEEFLPISSVPDVVFSGDLRNRLDTYFLSDAATEDSTVSLANMGFRPEEISALEKAGLATNGTMSYRQWTKYYNEVGARLSGKSAAPAAPTPAPTPEAVAPEAVAPEPAPAPKPEVVRIVSSRKGASWIIKGMDATGKKVFQLDPIKQSDVARDTVYRLVGENPKATLGVHRKILPDGMASVNLRKPSEGFNTLRSFIERIGGIKEEGGELAARNVPERLIRDTGVSHEEATRRAIDAGFFPDYVPPALRAGQESYQAPPEMVERFREALGQKKFDLPKKPEDAEAAKKRKEADIENDVLGPYMKDIKAHLKKSGQSLSDTDIRDAAILLHNGDLETPKQAVDYLHVLNDMEIMGDEMTDLDRENLSKIMGEDIWDDIQSLANLRGEGELRPEGIEPLTLGETDEFRSPEVPEAGAVPREEVKPVERPAEKEAPEAVSKPVAKEGAGKPEVKGEEIPTAGLTVERMPFEKLSSNLREAMRMSILERYFKPGDEIKSYYGKDQVLKFDRGTNGNWSVTVREVNKDGSFGRERQHSTFPEKKEIISKLGKGYDDFYVVKGDLLKNKKILDDLGFQPIRTVKGEKQRILIGENPAEKIKEAKPAAEEKPAAEVKVEPKKLLSKNSFEGLMKSKEQFTGSPKIPDEYYNVMREWAKMLGLKGRIHLITAEEHNKSFDWTGATKRKFKDNSNGANTHFSTLNANIITLRMRPRRSANLETLAHEMGHILEKETWASASPEEKKAVMDDYKAWLKRVKKLNAEQHIQQMRPIVGAKLFRLPKSVREKPSMEVLDPYYRRFNEYFADQVARYMISEAKPRTVVGKFFARIAEGLKRLYTSLAGQQGRASKSMREYIERRMTPGDSVMDAYVSRYEITPEVEAVVDESRSSLSQDTIDEIEELNRKHGMPKDIEPTKPDTPTETKLDKFRAKVQDVQIFLRKIQDELEKKNGGPLIDTMNAYARNLLMPGRISERIHDFNKDMVKPLFKRMKDLGITLDDLHKYMLAKHAPERNSEMAKRDPKRFGTLFDGGSGLTNGAAEELLARLEPKKEALEELSGMVRKIIDSDLDRRVEAGLMTEDQAKGLKELYKDYVPLRGFAERDMEEDHGGTFYNLGKGISVSKEEYKKAMGRKSQADNVVLNAIMQAEEGIYRAEKNRALEALYNLAKAYPNSELWEVGKMKAHKVIGEDGLVKWELDGMVGPNTVVVKIGGKPYYIDLKNPALAEAYGRLGPLPMARWFRPIAMMTRAWSQLQTSKNPAFIATNFQRDLADALFYTYGKDADVAKEVVKSLPEALKLTTKATLNKLSPEEKVIYDEWRKSGGRISYNAITDLEAKAGEFNRLVGDVSPLEWYKLPEKTKRVAEKAFYKVVDGLEKVAQPFEDGVRASVFIAARKVKNKDGSNKYTIEQAARMAQEASVNFYRKGRYSPYLNGLYAFFNASTQGAAMGLKLLKDSKKARLAFMSMVPFSFMLTMMNLGNSDDDPTQKGRKNYLNIPEFERQTGLLIKYGKGPKDYFKIRLPSLLMIPIIMGEQAALAAAGQQKLGKSVGNMFGGAISAFNPLGSNSLIGMVTPTLVDPIADILVNKKYSGAPIHPQPAPWNQGIPNSEQAFSTTAPWASALTQTIYKGTAGAVDIYPGDAEYVANWMIGGLGRNAGNVISFIKDIAQGKDPKISDLPIIRTFAPSQWNPGGRYYELHDAVDGKVNRLRAMARDMEVKPSPEKIKKFNEEAKGTGIYFDGQKVVTSGAPAIKAMRNADSILKQLRQQALAVQNDKKLSARQQQQKVDAIKAQMERVMVGAGKQMSIFDPRPSFGPLSNLVK